jgi:hypothetical protein
MQNAHPGTNLQRVMNRFGDLLITKITARGLQMNRDQLAQTALDDVERKMLEPSPWAQDCLAEFRSDPYDNYTG